MHSVHFFELPYDSESKFQTLKERPAFRKFLKAKRQTRLKGKQKKFGNKVFRRLSWYVFDQTLKRCIF